ncbi:hypothetical protein OSH07_24125 [Kaistia sp. K-TC2]|uniref:Uncharacterized protein n=2 Tax=Kaistia nematophila TaxID=2994654 RepID=A0A9X3E6Y2_9HYPH|nr:hypothetical protein [Kaistia nematophila]
MKAIAEKEYERRLSAFVADEKAKLPPERVPQGFFGNWGFHAHCRKMFDKRLAEDGIEVIRVVRPVDWPPQTGRIPR